VNDHVRVRFELTPLGTEIRTLLDELVQAGVASPHEVARHLKLEKALANWGQPAADREPGELHSTCESYRKELEPLYYLAKNVAYTSENFFKELEAFRVRFDFARSIGFVLVLGIHLVLIAYLARGIGTLRDDIGRLKTKVSIALSAVLALAAFNVMFFTGIETAICGAPFKLADFTTPTYGDEFSSRQACVATYTHFRIWLLPAAFLALLSYRVRRVWWRALDAVRPSRDSVLPQPRIFVHPREKEAKRALIAVATFLIALLPMRLAYESEQSNYTTRVYAYFEVQREARLHCIGLVAGSATDVDCNGEHDDSAAR
jgi:hypothetical protein